MNASKHSRLIYLCPQQELFEGHNTLVS